MKCPSCGTVMRAYRGRTSCTHVCVCGLQGTLDVLEALAARLAPAGVLAEAEALFAAKGVLELVMQTPRGRRLKRSLDPRDYYGVSIADVYAKTPEAKP